jgi:hypothetical protein
MPSILVWERLMKAPTLVGDVPVPEEGSVLPDSYSFRRGEQRSAVLKRMQEAMTKELDALWAKKGPDSVVNSKREAVILASVVEKETGKPSERPMVAGVYSNRVRIGMKLDADPTVIYPITKGKPLGRRIRRSELMANNGYNTYAMAGLPAGPIANPGRESIAAVLNPARTQALYFVADGTGGHIFANTLAEHNANVRNGTPFGASAARCKSAQAAPFEDGDPLRDGRERLDHGAADMACRVDEVLSIGHEADMSFEENKIAPPQSLALGKRLPQHPLLIAVAGRGNSAEAERNLHQARAVDAARASAAEQVRRAEEAFGNRDRVMLCRIDRAQMRECEEAKVRREKPALLMPGDA